MKAKKNQPPVKGKKEVPATWKERIGVQDYESLRDIFLLFDEDGSGTIDPQQIVKVLQQIGLDKRNPHVLRIVWAMRERNKILSFDEFLDCVCLEIGECKTKDGLERIFKMYDKENKGTIRFEQLKEISRTIGEHLDDEALLDLMHSIFINRNTTSNEEFTFEEFYQVISHYYSYNPLEKPQ